MKLFCFPHAGGGSLAFRGWRHPDDALEIVPVVLPAREARWGEPMPATMADLVTSLVNELGDQFHGTYGFFGHSFGSGVAYELTCTLLDLGLTPPQILAVSGRRAPNRPANRPPVHNASDEVFLGYLKELGGIPDEVLQHPPLLRTFLPTLRSDFAIHETYTPASAPKIPVPISAFTGAADQAVSVVDVLAWRDVAAGAFRARVLSGGHFYLRDHSHTILSSIYEDLGVAA